MKGPRMGQEDEDGTISLVRTSDTTRALACVALLESKGIWSHAQGLSDASLGALAIVRVRASDEKRARRLLRSIERGKSVRPLGEEDAEKPTYRGSARIAPEPDADPDRLVRLKRVATMVAVVIPGGGHLYTRRYDIALVLWCLYGVVLFAAFHGVVGAGMIGFGIMAADATGASWLCDESQGKPVQHSLRRFAIPAAAILAPLALLAMR